MDIEDVHANNFRLIEKHDLKVGDVMRHKNAEYTQTIIHIHPLYGWIITKGAFWHERLHQDITNINDFEKVASAVEVENVQ